MEQKYGSDIDYKRITTKREHISYYFSQKTEQLKGTMVMLNLIKSRTIDVPVLIAGYPRSHKVT